MRKINSLAIASCLVVVVSSFAQEKVEAQYGGVATCKACHLSAASGAQFKIWQASPHAKSFETLKSEAAMKIAKEVGIEDPTKADACLKCHVTAHGVAAEQKGPQFFMEQGVICEACHGPGSDYKNRQVMQDIYEGKIDGSQYGLVEPTKEVCITCHNEESPTFKGFDFAKYVKTIEHPTPRDFVLRQNYPNPFNSETVIQYGLQEAVTVSLTVFDMLGREVRRLAANEFKLAGSYTVNWNGRDDAGNLLSSGTYFYRVRFETTGRSHSLVRKMIFLK